MIETPQIANTSGTKLDHLKKEHQELSDHLNPPYGGTLVNGLMNAERATDIQAESRDWPS